MKKFLTLISFIALASFQSLVNAEVLKYKVDSIKLSEFRDLLRNKETAQIIMLLENGLSPNLLNENFFMSPLQNIADVTSKKREDQLYAIEMYKLMTRYGANFQLNQHLRGDATVMNTVIAKGLLDVFDYLVGEHGLNYISTREVPTGEYRDDDGIRRMFSACNIKMIDLVYGKYGEETNMCNFFSSTMEECDPYLTPVAKKYGYDWSKCK